MRNVSHKLLVLVIVVLCAGALCSACSSPVSSGGGGSLTQAEVEVAVAVAITAYIEGGLGSLSGPVPGVDYNLDTFVVTFDGYDVSSSVDGSYATITGTVTPEASEWDFDVSLTGGPVDTLVFSLTSLDQETSVNVTANGESYTIVLDNG